MILDPPEAVAYDSIVMRHAAPVRRTYLLLHGLTASPLQFADVGARLFEDGANVYIPRLPGHGHGDRLTTALADLTAAALVAFVYDVVARARTLGDELVVGGFSVGGLLGAIIAQRFAVASVVCIAPFVGMKWMPRTLARPAASAALATENRFVWWHPFERERLGPVHGYPRVPSHAVARALDLGRELLVEAAAAPPATAKIRLVLNASETTVSNAAAYRLARAWTAGGVPVAIDRLCGLPPSHDIVEPLRAGGLAARVAPEILRAIRR